MKKTGTTTDVRQKVTVKETISRSGSHKNLDAAQERALRMRHGVGLDSYAPLPNKAEGFPETARKLLEMEAQILQAIRRKQRIHVQEDSEELETRAAPRIKPTESRVKSKIVRALRKKT